MIPSFDCMGDRIVDLGLQRIAVAAAQDDDVLLSIDNAARLGIAEPLLIGRRSDILKAGERCGVNAGGYGSSKKKTTLNHAGCVTIREGQADAIMKGLVSTAYVLKAILAENRYKRRRIAFTYRSLYSRLPALSRSRIRHEHRP